MRQNASEAKGRAEAAAMHQRRSWMGGSAAVTVWSAKYSADLSDGARSNACETRMISVRCIRTSRFGILETTDWRRDCFAFTNERGRRSRPSA